MAAMQRIGVLAIALGLGALAPCYVSAAGFADLAAAADERDSGYYEQPAYQPDTRALIHQKAQANAAQRRARLASLNWYGMSNSRPTASPTPFATRYSPVWEMPGPRPFAWHAGNRPAYIFYSR